jgi:hypothetical protein
VAEPSPNDDASLAPVLKEAWREGKWLFYLWLLGVACVVVWLYGTVDLFLKHKIIEAAAAFVVLLSGSFTACSVCLAGGDVSASA